MFNSCKRHIDYSERRETIKSGIVHAVSKIREGACGHYFNSFGDSKSVINTTPITCKSCLKVLGANDTNVPINTANLFAVRTKEGLFLDDKGSLTSNVSKARTFKLKENAINAIKEDVYVHKDNENETLTYYEYIKLDAKKRYAGRGISLYVRTTRPKKGFNIVSVTLSFNEDSSYNEECPSSGE